MNSRQYRARKHLLRREINKLRAKARTVPATDRRAVEIVEGIDILNKMLASILKQEAEEKRIKEAAKQLEAVLRGS